MSIPGNIQSPQKWRKKGLKNFRVKKISGGGWRLPKINFKPLLRRLTPLGIIAFFILAIFIAGLFAWTARDLPDPARLIDRSVAQSTKIYDRTGQTILYDIHGQYQRTMIELADMPDLHQMGFYRHRRQGILPAPRLVAQTHRQVNRLLRPAKSRPLQGPSARRLHLNPAICQKRHFNQRKNHCPQTERMDFVLPDRKKIHQRRNFENVF